MYRVQESMMFPQVLPGGLFQKLKELPHLSKRKTKGWSGSLTLMREGEVGSSVSELALGRSFRPYLKNN
jgi:hypothetical protein